MERSSDAVRHSGQSRTYLPWTRSRRDEFQQTAQRTKGNSDLSNTQTLTAEQINAARLVHWHQASLASQVSPAADDEANFPSQNTAVALLTQDALRSFVQRAGLVLFSPRSQMAAAPAPTIVEATLGRQEGSPSLTDVAEARKLVAQLVAGGSAIALNLLGAATTTAEDPDFIVTASAFPYIFTLRGDKLWKQPPANSGATKVSPLALNTFTVLAEQGPRSANDLVTELGKGLTEAAVLRALSELWQHLRVLPVPQVDGTSTIWEITATRFTKQMKAGANAGQPSALSALVSLYLGQSLLATEDEIETFLSPLAPRSRVRDVLHALSAGQQLETLVIEGKQYVHLAGELPRFAEAGPWPARGAPASGDAAVELAEDGSRIRTFKPHKVGTGFVSRPKPFAASARPDRERRPFNRSGDRSGPGSRPSQDSRSGRKAKGAKPADRRSAGPRASFSRPWEEERAARPTRPPYVQDVDPNARAAAIPTRPSTPGSNSGSRSGPARRPRPIGGERPAYTRNTVSRGGDTRRPTGGGTRFGADRPGSFGAKNDRPGFNDRKSGSFKAGGFKKAGFKAPAYESDRRSGPAEGAAAPGADWSGRPKRTERPSTFGSGGRQDRGRTAGGFAPRPRISLRPEAEHGSSPGSKSIGRREPKGGFTRAARPGTDRRSETSAFGNTDQRRSSPGRSFAGKAAGAAAGPERTDRPFRRFDAPRGPKPPFSPRDGATRAERDVVGKRPTASSRTGSFGRAGATVAGNAGSGSKDGPARRGARGPRLGGASTSAPARVSTFEKFKGGNKPWGKRPPARKPKPVEEEG